MPVLLLSLVLLFFATTPNLGFFTFPAITLVSSALLILLVSLSTFKKPSQLNAQETKTLIPLTLFTLLFYGVIYYGGLYQNKESFVLGYFLLGIFVLATFIRFVFFKKTFTLLFICSIYTLLSFWTIYNSPHPTVDTVVVLKEAPLMLLKGQNPYASTFTQVYPNINPDYYNYLPFSFFYSLPFVLLFKDPRYLTIFSNLLSAFLIYKLFKSGDKESVLNLFITSFLFLPRTFYMLEHAYLDPVIFSFFLTFFYFFVNKNKSGISYLFLGLFFSMKQPPILTIPLFINSIEKLRGILRPRNLSLFLIPFSLPLFYLLINTKAFFEDVFSGLNPSKITSPISASLTLPTLLKYFSIPATSAYIIGSILLLLAFIYIFKARRSLVFKIALFFLSFNYFTYHAFFNSYYLVALFLFLEIAVIYFWKDKEFLT